MNDQENRKRILVLWIELAEYYGMVLTDSQLRNYADDCAHYEAKALERGMELWRKNPRNTRLPLPAQLLASMGGGASRADAGAIALSLVGAVKRHDYTWTMRLNTPYVGGSFEAEFRNELGDVAWEVVRMAGGWSMFCGTFHDCGNETAFLAQIRDATEHVLTTKRGQVTAFPKKDHPPELPHVTEGMPDAQRRINELASRIVGPKDPKEPA